MFAFSLQTCLVRTQFLDDAHHGPVDARGLSGQRVVGGTLVAERTRACFVLPLQEAAAHFAGQNATQRASWTS
jgi:hypothetical protein